jgi:hypothetical protein
MHEITIALSRFEADPQEAEAKRQAISDYVARCFGTEFELFEEPSPSDENWREFLRDLSECLNVLKSVLQTMQPIRIVAHSTFEVGSTIDEFVSRLVSWKSADFEMHLVKEQKSSLDGLEFVSPNLRAIVEMEANARAGRMKLAHQRRNISGEPNRRSKLSADKSKAIEADLLRGDQSLRSIATAHEVSLDTVQGVRKRMHIKQHQTRSIESLHKQLSDFQIRASVNAPGSEEHLYLHR